ncbi:hypothetical protein Tco_0731243 [Tanacetum coccineum]
MSLRTTMLAQQSQIRELQSVDHRRQTVITEMLAADHRRQKQLTEALKLIKRLQTQMAEFERQQGPAKGPTQPEIPEEAVISSSKLPIGQDHKERITGYVKKAQEKGIFTLISLSEETQHVTSQIATLAIRVCTYEDEVLPVEEQPLPAAASPTAQSPDYVPESDPEEDDGEDPKEDHVDYPADGGRRPDMRMIHLMDYEEGVLI